MESWSGLFPRLIRPHGVSVRSRGLYLEGVKKLAVCVSARKDGGLVEVLGCGLSHGMGNYPFQLSRVMNHG